MAGQEEQDIEEKDDGNLTVYSSGTKALELLQNNQQAVITQIEKTCPGKNLQDFAKMIDAVAQSVPEGKKFLDDIKASGITLGQVSASAAMQSMFSSTPESVEKAFDACKKAKDSPAR